MAGLLAFLPFTTVLLSTMAIAQDYGVQGHLYEIAEENLIDYLQAKLDGFSEDEKLSIRKKISEQSSKKLTEPSPVEGVSLTKTSRVVYFDPTLTTAQDIVDHKKNVVVPKGTRVNPLEKVQLKEELLFIDATLQEHVEWARKQTGKWVLVNGKPLEQESMESRPIYFDQRGILCKRLGIKEVPARVSQEGHKLKIEFISLGGN